MNQEKQLSDFPWIKEEVSALRREDPQAASIDRAVANMQAAPPTQSRPIHPKHVKRLAMAAAFGSCVLLVTKLPSIATAAELNRITASIRAQKTRHTVDLRPDANGKLVQAREEWVDGDCQVDYFKADGGIIGFDGERQFIYRPETGGSIDDSPIAMSPIEDLSQYLAIPSAKLVNTQKGLDWNNRKLDRYDFAFGNGEIDVYIAPESHLPIRRDVLAYGKLIERDFYDYPVRFAAQTFQPPKDRGITWTDYPALRREFAKATAKPIATKELGGIQIALRSVIVGPHELVVLWTGSGELGKQGKNGATAAGIPGSPFSTPLDKTNLHPPLPAMEGSPVKAEAVWFDGADKLPSPLTVTIPVRSQGKLLGSLSFEVPNPMHAPEPERVLWRPSDEIGHGATKG